MIRFNHVSHSGVGDGVALKNVSFHISPGQPAAIIGPVGAGQDLIMSMCVLEVEPHEGKVILDGQDTRDLRSGDLRRLRRSTGIVSRAHPLLHDRSVLENVTLALEIRGWSRRRAVRRALKALESTGALAMKGAYPDAVPSEDRALVALARAIAAGPRLLLAQYVLDSLPKEKAGRFLAVLRDMAALGATVMSLETRIEPVDLPGWRVYSLNAGIIERVEIIAPSNQPDRRVSLVDRLIQSTN
jgi:cell division transport system ATP-binding protein